MIHACKFHIWLARQWRACLARPWGRHRRHLPAREAFKTADALYCREARTSLPSRRVSELDNIHSEICTAAGVFGVVRTDTQACSVSSVSNTKSCRTIRSFGWPSSSAKRLTWTASSFYRMVPKSALPPHSVVRRRTSSLVTQ